MGSLDLTPSRLVVVSRLFAVLQLRCLVIRGGDGHLWSTKDMHGIWQNGNHSTRNGQHLVTTTETVHIKIEPGIEMPKSFRNSRHVLTNSAPKILNFSMAMDQAKRQKPPQIKQEPEMILDDDYSEDYSVSFHFILCVFLS